VDPQRERWWARTPEQRQVDLDRLRAAVSRAETVVASEGREVTVRLGSGGALMAIDISRYGMQLSGPALGALITRTLASAAAESLRTMRDEVREITGGYGYLGTRLPDVPPPPSVPELDDEADETEARVHAVAVEARDQVYAYAEAREELAGQRISARTADGTVQATVTADGTVTEVRIDDAALRHGASVLGPRVCAVIQEARAKAALATADRIGCIPGVRLDIRELVERYVPGELRDQDGRR
jgi:DNA-binding protein YbaB